MALKAVCVMKGDGATQGVINLCQEVCQMYSSGMALSAALLCCLAYTLIFT